MLDFLLQFSLSANRVDFFTGRSLALAWSSMDVMDLQTMLQNLINSVTQMAC
jgi:hypothetical protein